MHICKMYAAYLQLIKTDSEQCIWKNHKQKPPYPTKCLLISLYLWGRTQPTTTTKKYPLTISRNISYYASWPTYLNNQPTNIFI